MQLHLLTMLIGAFSFAIPLLSRFVASPRAGEQPAAPALPGPPGAAADEDARPSKQKRTRSKTAGKKTARVARTANASTAPVAVWRLSPFRLLLFAAFSWLSLQATRNSHQFAAVVGAVTAWNFGEWAAVMRERRQMRAPGSPPRWSLPARPSAFGMVGLLILWVGSGQFFRMTGEGRTIGFGEDRLWFPHEAVKFAGKEVMPDRFLSFHNGHAALYEYYHGPRRKVYIDPRLEVAGADLFRRYNALGKRIEANEAGWDAELTEMARPVILSDHFYNSEIGATLLQSDHWRCVWFDAIAAVFVHDSSGAAVRADTRFRRSSFPARSEETAARSSRVARLEPSDRQVPDSPHKPRRSGGEKRAHSRGSGWTIRGRYCGRKLARSMAGSIWASSSFVANHRSSRSRDSALRSTRFTICRSCAHSGASACP